MKKQLIRTLSLIMALVLVLCVLPAPAHAADYIAANHTRSNGCPYYIMVNRYCNTVTIYTLDSAGYYTVPYKAMVCSTGRAGHATPAGTFAIAPYKKQWNLMVDGTYGQYATEFNGNILFHSICYTATRNNAMITEEYNLLGDYASLGCVRLQVADAKWIYDNCVTGTLVTVYDGNDPGPLGKPAKEIAYISPAYDCGWDPTDPAYGNPWNVKFTAAVSDWSTGSGTVSGSGTYKKTQTATATAVPAYGSTFAGWYNEAGYQISTSPTASFTVTENMAVYALFLQEERDVSVVASRSGSATGAGKYAPGAAAVLKATPATGKSFDGWYSAEGKLITKNTTASITVPNYDSLYYALFAGDVFADIPAGVWYLDSAMWAADAGIVSGTTPVTFSPNTIMNRAMAVTLISRLDGIDPSAWAGAATVFADAKQGSYYYGPVCWASENNIVKGTSANHFSPEDAVTREQFMTFLMRYAVDYLGMTIEEAELPFSDAGQISVYARTPMAQAYALGILKGYSDNTVLPRNYLTRAEGVTLIMRLQQALAG